MVDSAFAQPSPIRATIDASKKQAPISPFVYGQFLEHIGGIVNTGVWAEMLNDRKFFYPVLTVEPEPESAPAPFGRGAQRSPWISIGSPDALTMDSRSSFVGEHSPRIALDASERRGIEHRGLVIEQNESYVGRIALSADGDVEVIVSLVWGDGLYDRDDVTIDLLARDYVIYPLTFTSGTDTEEARLEIVATGTGSLRIGVVSLMPADNVGGFRPEIVSALKALRSGVYRFPGGNFVSGHEWRNAIGDRDRRPPTVDPAWGSVQPNDVGTDEFITLCRLLDVEPYITVNAGFGDAWSAARLVEYTNGSALTEMGRARAANGHPEPYNVKFWGVGNEAWGSWQMGAMSVNQFVVKHNDFARAMLAVDSTIVLIGSGAMPDAMTGSGESMKRTGQLIPEPLGPADWTGGLLKGSLDYMDMISEHFYSYGNTRFDMTVGEQVPLDEDEPLVDWMRRPANHVRSKVEAYQDYLELIPELNDKPIPIVMAEWAYARAGTNTYRAVPAHAWVFHEMFRHSELYKMANFTFATSLLSASRTDAVLNPVGLVFKLYRDHYGTVPVEVSGNSPQTAPKYPIGGEEPRVNAGSPTFPLDVVAAWTDDQQGLTVGIINPTETEQTLELAFQNADLSGDGSRWQLAPDSLNARIVVGEDPEVVVEQDDISSIPDTIVLPKFSVTIYRFDTY